MVRGARHSICSEATLAVRALLSHLVITWTHHAAPRTCDRALISKADCDWHHGSGLTMPPSGTGANAQWLGLSNRYVVYNDRQCVEGSTPDDLCAVIYDVVKRQRARVLPRPVFSISPDGAMATSVDFIRLQKVRRGEQLDRMQDHAPFGWPATRNNLPPWQDICALGPGLPSRSVHGPNPWMTKLPSCGTLQTLLTACISSVARQVSGMRRASRQSPGTLQTSARGMMACG